MNKRLLLALVLSFLVLSLYGYLMPKQKVASSDVNKSIVEQKSVATNSKVVAPSAPATNAPVASATTDTNDVKNPDMQASNTQAIATVNTKKYTLTFDNLGRVNSVVLKDKKYKTEDGKALDIINKETIKPLEVRFKDEKINTLAFSTDYSASTQNVDATSNMQELVLTQKLGDKTLTKTIKFYPDGHYDLKISAPNLIYYITPGFRPTVDKSMYLVVRGTIIRDSKGVITTLEKGDVKEVQTFADATVISDTDRYYSTIFYKKSGIFTTTVAPSGVKDYEKDPVAFVSVKDSDELSGYIGAKEWKSFAALDPKLTDTIEFGWFTFLAKPFFKVMLAIYNFVGNWGWAIVLFTILVKIILFPLSYKGLMSMQKLKDLAPKMKDIREKYGKDPAKMNQQMMALYKKHGANPMGGCLPMLLQVPIFFALYRVLLNADELQGAPWIGWIVDLSHKDPYFILPILMGLSMYIQQKLTPNSMTDPMQQKIFQFLPVIMTFFFLTFPSGLVLYWLTNNILTIAQQYYINSAYAKYKQRQKASAK